MSNTVSNTVSNTMSNNDIPIKPKPKRGRKSKAELMAALNIKSIDNVDSQNVLQKTYIVNDNAVNDNAVNDNTELCVKPALKKRGRKPKGGKIIQQVTSLESNKQDKPNVILHLKCSTKDLNFATSEHNTSIVESYIPNQSNDLSFDFISHNEDNDLIKSYYNTTSNDDNVEQSNGFAVNEQDSKEVWQKLKQLEHNLHTNNINDKKSACFWCTCDFDNPQIFIPKYYMSSSNSYQVYGCFCSPECAVASLMSESIDSSTKFERYHFLNHLYAKIFDYTKNIKPAPNPYYMLDKYYGNLSIQEYRSLLRNERLFLIVDKPLTRILPELHEDNDDFMLNNKIIPSNNYQLKKRTQKKHNKANILNETFGLNVE